MPSLLIFFGLLMTPLLDHYGMLVEENMISDYQYVLKMPVQTKNEAAEKYAVKSLILDKTDRKLRKKSMSTASVKIQITLQALSFKKTATGSMLLRVF